jgi:molybdopterin converting factor subunit 1
MITVEVKLFAGAKDAAGTSALRLSLDDGAPVRAVLDALGAQYPRFREWLPYLKLAVNCEYVGNDHALHNNDEVAIIPPVSGG